MNKNDQELVDKAMTLAKEVHKNQTRDDGTPYYNHIEGVVKILTDELKVNNYFELTVAALHDVIEDSLYTEQDLTGMFGKNIAEGVQALTKSKGMKMEAYFHQIDSNRSSGRLWIVKMADRIYNVRDLENIINTKPEKVKKYIKETEMYFVPKSKEMPKIYSDILNESLEKIKGLCK